MRSKLAINNILTTLILQVITLICGFIIPKLIISFYGSNVNGLVTSITKFLAYISLLELGFGPVVKSVLYKPIAYKNKDEIEKILKASEKFFKNIAYIFIAYILILCFAMPMIVSDEFSLSFTIPLVIIIAISTFAEYYFGMTYRLYLQAEQKTYIISIIQVSTLVLNTIITVTLVKLGVCIHIVKLVTAIIFIFRPILQNLYVKKKYSINLKHVDNDYKIKQKWDGMAQHIAYVIHSNTDIIILTLCSSMTEVSVYYVYLIIVTSIKNIIQSLTNGIDATFGNMVAKGEIDKLNKALKLYEVIYFTIITIIFSGVLFLITPFVGVYTKGIMDVNYFRPVFGYLIVISEFIWAIREPYNTIIKVAGHFKETKIGAWVEAIINISISILLVWKYGIVGVAIGTLVAISIRAVELVYHTSKYILKRTLGYIFKYIVIMLLEVLIITLFVRLLPKVDIQNYVEWIIQAIKITVISTITVLLVNIICYKQNIKEIIKFTKNRLKGARAN
ncbi:MAG: polysaccharide biosynthesis C-terminal domain-containing protein [Clostridia bacterium]|nr:polysaccharide biosynthesis C-terminal domain-containing protein [Clostridia bacterium]